jgi:hypothetical protein
MLTENTRITTNVRILLIAGGIAAALVTAYGNLAVRLATLEQNYISISKELINTKNEIERNRIERVKSIDELRAENNAQHITLREGQDRIIGILLKQGR